MHTMSIDLQALLKAKGLRLSDLARSIDVNKATVTRWAQKSVPLTRVYQVEEKTGISRHELRPDFFGEAAA
jgi:transcriptional regulator with XRE-family HTH domain